MTFTTPERFSESWTLDRFRPDPREVARHDDPDALRRLGGNMLAHGQLQQVGATAAGRLIFGTGRFLAATAVGLTALDTWVYPDGLSDSRLALIRLSENLHRKELSGYQQWVACADLLCGNPDWQIKDVADHMHLTPSAMTRILSPSRCVPAWQEALRAGRVGITDCYAASKRPQAEQAALLDLKLGGASRDAIEAAGRRSRAAPVRAVQAARVKCQLPSGYTVVISGGAVTLDEAVDALAEASREMKRARDLGYTARTFASAMSDRSRKG